ncbi:response regulator [bacterium]|nr:response regulator [bacterium]
MENERFEILLIEDNVDHAELIITQIEKASGKTWHVNLVSDGEEAMSYLFHKDKFESERDAPKPWLILLDLKIPKLDGFEVLKIIKTDDELKSIPVVVLTTSTTDEDIKKSYEYGADSYIAKPLAYEDFVNVITKIKIYWDLSEILPAANGK